MTWYLIDNNPNTEFQQEHPLGKLVSVADLESTFSLDASGYVVSDISLFGLESAETIVQKIMQKSDSLVVVYSENYSIDRELTWLNVGVDLVLKAPESLGSILNTCEQVKQTIQVPYRDFMHENIASSNVLLVEDAIHDKAKVEKALAGHRMSWVQTEAEFKALNVADTDYSLCVIDILLGHDEDGGFEIANQLKSSGKTPFVFYTSFRTDREQSRALESGAWDYLVKGMNIKLMRQRLEKWLKYSQFLRGQKQGGG